MSEATNSSVPEKKPFAAWFETVTRAAAIVAVFLAVFGYFEYKSRMDELKGRMDELKRNMDNEYSIIRATTTKATIDVAGVTHQITAVKAVVDRDVATLNNDIAAAKTDVRQLRKDFEALGKIPEELLDEKKRAHVIAVLKLINKSDNVNAVVELGAKLQKVEDQLGSLESLIARINEVSKKVENPVTTIQVKVGSQIEFEPGWENYSPDPDNPAIAGNAQAKALRDNITGRISLEGSVKATKNHGNDPVIFTLPNGWRPQHDRSFATLTGRVNVHRNGQVFWIRQVASGESCSLDGVSFRSAP